jgi:chromate transport protein ChrA
MNLIGTLLKIFVIILIFEFIYKFLFKNVFNEQVFLIQNADITMKPFAAATVYVFIAFSLYWFIIKENKTPKDAFILGLCTFGIFQYINYCLFNNWKFETTLIDTTWGGMLFYLTTYFYQL